MALLQFRRERERERESRVWDYAHGFVGCDNQLQVILGSVYVVLCVIASLQMATLLGLVAASGQIFFGLHRVSSRV